VRLSQESSKNDMIPLITFDKLRCTTFSFDLVNDPVMGGESASEFSIHANPNEDSFLRWNGTIVDVPSLRAPGFCSIKTDHYFRSRFNDASGSTHLKLLVKSTTPEYRGFKVSFSSIFTVLPTFWSFKADFNVPPSVSGEWQWVDIPFSNFSNNWSAYTGEPLTRCADDPKVCPKERDLKHIKRVTLWAEGSSAPFSLDVLGIYSGGAEADLPIVSSIDEEPAESKSSWCENGLQTDLRFNVSKFMANDVLPFYFPEDESLAEAVCCDPDYTGYAEPRGFFARDDVSFLRGLNESSPPTTFYDPVCGIPLFVAPQGRTFEEFYADTVEHGWPSFRKHEVLEGNVFISDDGRNVKSKCGTRLGTYEPDELGHRYCMDVACISGNPVQDNTRGTVSHWKIMKILHFTIFRPISDSVNNLLQRNLYQRG